LRGYAALRGPISTALVGSLGDDPKLSVRLKAALSTASSVVRRRFEYVVIRGEGVLEAVVSDGKATTAKILLAAHPRR
jgi:hypothetical protein